MPTLDSTCVILVNGISYFCEPNREPWTISIWFRVKVYFVLYVEIILGTTTINAKIINGLSSIATSPLIIGYTVITTIHGTKNHNHPQ